MFVFPRNVGRAASGIALVLLLSAATPGFSRQQPVPQKSTFQSLYAQRDAGMKRKDADAVMKTVAEGYQLFDESGSIHISSKAKERERLIRVFARASTIESKTTVDSISIVGKDAIVTVRSEYTRTQTDPARNLVGKLNEVGESRDFWISTGGVWQIRRSRTLSLTSTKTINGQKVD